MSETVEVTQQFEHVSVMRVKPGDVLIFRTHLRLTQAQAETIQAQAEEAFPGTRSIVLSDTLELAVGRVVEVGEA